MFFRIMAFLRHALILALVTLLLGSCATIVTEEVLSPPKLLKQAITSIQVKRFAGEYGRQLSVQIEGNLQTVSLIKIRTHGAQAVLTGSIQVARVTSDSYSKSFKVKKKDSNGKKYKTTKTYYYLQKRGLASLTYSLVSGSKVLASNAHNAMFERVSSGASSQEAKASAISNNEIISDLIGQLAEKVIQDISPHKTHFSFQLQKGGHDYLNIGIAYYKKELYSQAEEYWNRVLNAVYSNPQDRAAAAYNLGVLYVHNGALPQAFQMFRQADGLHPLNTVYMDALKLVEHAGKMQKDLRGFSGGSRGGPSYGLTIHAPQGSRVRIMNIKPKYRQGIQLPAGRYDLLVEQEGYQSHREWITITNKAISRNISLREE